MGWGGEYEKAILKEVVRMNRIQSCEVWRNENSMQKKVHTKASKAVKSVPTTAKTREGSERVEKKQRVSLD